MRVLLLAERACASAGECRWDPGAVVSGAAISRKYKNDPKMAQNGPKMAKKVTGVPQKSQKNRKNGQNGPTEPHVIALKRVKMH